LFKVYGTDISIDLDINRIAQEIHENVNGSGHWINTLWSRLGYAIDTEVEKLAWRIRNEN
jgi:hypothetical protein